MQSNALVCAAALAAGSALIWTAVQDPAKDAATAQVRAEFAGVRFVPASAADDCPFGAEQPGLSVAFSISAGDRFVVSAEAFPRQQPRFVDDSGRAVVGAIGSASSAGRDGEPPRHSIFVESVDPVAEAATRVTLSGRVHVRTAAGSAPFRSEVVPCAVGSELSAGDFGFEVSRLEDGQIGLRTEGDTDAIRAYRFFDGEGQRIESEFVESIGGRSRTASVRFTTFRLGRSADKLALEVEVWQGLAHDAAAFEVELALPVVR